MFLTLLLVLSVTLLLLLIYRSVRNRPAKPESSDSNASYHHILLNEVQFYRHLDDMERKVFLNKVHLFLDRVIIEGVGTSINDTDRMLIAASAVIPIFNFGSWMYRNITNVVLYPDIFNNDFEFEGATREIAGMVGSGYMNGQMILSKTSLYKGFSEAGGKNNTAIHEFVHLLDGSDGSIDGVPELLMNHAAVIPWLKVIEHEVRQIEKGKSDIDPYAITNQAEFLAVVAEYFFEKPDKFKKHHPELYEMMDHMFNPETKQSPGN